MKLVVPNYFKEFKCIADKCKDCCCIGWEIDIDETTAKYYKSLKTVFGKELCQNISFGETNHFILDSKKRCHFLNEKNLCNVFLEIGENHLCQICAEHPRYYEWFKDIKEGGIGLCCEEACRIILSQTNNFSTEEKNIEFEECDEYDSVLYELLYTARKNIIDFFNNNSEFSESQKSKIILLYANELQNCINSDNFEKAKKLQISDFENLFVHSKSNIQKCTNLENQTSLKNFLHFYINLEPLDIKWTEYLKNQIDLVETYYKNINEFEKNNPQIDQYLRNLAIYFIWRYFLKGCFDSDIISKVAFMVASIHIIKFLFFCKWYKYNSITLNDCILIVKQYSKEIEYSDTNMYEILDSYYFNNEFKVENLLRLY